MPPPVLPNTAGMSLPQMGIDPGINVLDAPDKLLGNWTANAFGSVNDWLSNWGFTLPGFAPTPAAPQPMQKGNPQAPASEGTSGQQAQAQKSVLRDVIIYAGVAIVVIIGISAALR